jgi:predicted naringenin-chalcone synthase
MVDAYINRIGTAVPPFDVHQTFSRSLASLLPGRTTPAIIGRLVERAQIDHRYSFLPPEFFLKPGGFYQQGQFPDTLARMRFFEQNAPVLAIQALEAIDLSALKDDVTHLIVACCTGFYAPGIDVDIINHFGLKPSVERTFIGFMGCYAAVNALKLARHIVRSEPGAKVVVVNVELCTIHLQEIQDLDQMLCFLIWGDGASACLVSSEPSGIELQSFHSMIISAGADQLAWRIGQSGFDIVLSSKVAQTLGHSLPGIIGSILGGRQVSDIALWAVHPGGRAILDAVGRAFGLQDAALQLSREVLRQFGNMSSATLVFVLKDMLEKKLKGLGSAMAFGPGLGAESMVFEAAG